MERKKRSLFQLAVALCIALMLLVVPQAVQAEEQAQASASYVTMYRLYNPNSGEHLYTKDSNEVSVLTRIGWKKEGEAWKAAKSGTPVYRLYNPNNGDHHYTLDKNEYNTLGRIGWRKEGVAWYSDSNKGVAVYRLFNPSQTGAGSHHYTTDKNEYKVLKTKGWRQEGISWYGVKAGSITQTTAPKGKYSYELYTTCSTIYSNLDIPVFIKTDNPACYSGDNQTFWLYSNGSPFYDLYNNYYDVNYTYDDDWGIRKVEGGYLTVISFPKAGTYTLSVTEEIDDWYQGLGEVTVKVVDTQSAADQWQYSIINKVTTSNMDSFEKMEAVTNYLSQEFKYLKNDGYYLLFSAADGGYPYFVRKEWDSCTSPRVLCEIAEKIGGFDKINNCYDDYNADTIEWMENHFYAEVTIGKETRRYEACPSSDSNVITDMTKINWFKSNKLKKL